jgi:hypothetical protein
MPFDICHGVFYVLPVEVDVGIKKHLMERKGGLHSSVDNVTREDANAGTVRSIT